MRTLFGLIPMLSTLAVCLLVSFPSYAQHQKANRNIIRIGIEGGSFIFSPPGMRPGGEKNDFQKLLDHWDQSHPNFIVHELFEFIPGVTASGYVGITVANFLEVRPELDYLYTPVKLIGLSTVKEELVNFGIKAYSPGVSLNFMLGGFQLGGGIYRSTVEFAWDDRVDNFSNSWSGSDWTYQANIGLNGQVSRNFGISLALLYKRGAVENLVDIQGKVLQLPGGNRNFSMDLSGVELQIGMYLSFQPKTENY